MSYEYGIMSGLLGNVFLLHCRMRHALLRDVSACSRDLNRPMHVPSIINGVEPALLLDCRIPHPKSLSGRQLS